MLYKAAMMETGIIGDELERQLCTEAEARQDEVSCKVGTKAWTTYESASAAALSLKVDSGNVSACCNEKRKQTAGFEFAAPNEPDTLEGEEWRPVRDTNAAVSSLSRFRDPSGVVKTPAPGEDGYVRVKVDKKTYRIHRLIAEAFKLSRKPGQNTVNHKDLNPSNNRITNLE